MNKSGGRSCRVITILRFRKAGACPFWGDGGQATLDECAAHGDDELRLRVRTLERRNLGGMAEGKGIVFCNDTDRHRFPECRNGVAVVAGQERSSAGVSAR